MKSTRTRSLSALVTTGVLGLSLAACGSSSSTAAPAAGGTSATSMAAPTSAMAPATSAMAPATSAMAPATSAMAPSSSTSMMASGAAMAAPFGAGCVSVPKSGAGSFNGMETAPVATAASANPLLSTLVAAVKAAGLVDTLNSASNITVFAPDNAAFAKIKPAALKALLANKAELTKILTYHVIGSSVSPADLGTKGPFKSLEGGTVAVAGSGTDFTVNGSSKVVCGGVHTANATVYIVDTVLMPPAA